MEWQCFFFMILWRHNILLVSFMSSTIVQFVNLWITIAEATLQEKHYTNGMEDVFWGTAEYYWGPM